MMTAETSASKKVIEETRRLYSNLLLKPPDEKLLQRPPFKFIQELVKSLITETKILRDVYTPADFDLTKRAWDRRAKTEFVQKLVDYAANNKMGVANCLASRVVSGLEPNKTNELLQSLAKIAMVKRSASNERRPRTFLKPLAGGGHREAASGARAAPAGSGSTKAAGGAKIARPVRSEAPNRRQSSSSSRRSSVSVEPSQRAGSGREEAAEGVGGSQPAQEEAELGAGRRASGDENSFSPLRRRSSQLQRDAGSNRSSTFSLGERAQQQQQQERTGAQRQPVVQIVGESDINKNILYLAASLRSLRSILADASKGEELLKDELDKLQSPEVEREAGDS